MGHYRAHSDLVHGRHHNLNGLSTDWWNHQRRATPVENVRKITSTNVQKS